MKAAPILTGMVGTNAVLIREVARMYIPDKAVVYDTTYGRGVFWQEIDTGRFKLFPSDLAEGTNFCSLPYSDSSGDVLVLDPPYMHGGETIKKSINDCYRNANTSHQSVIRLYAGGLLEAARVLKKGGLALVKTQDEIESGKQRWSHIELISLMEMFGFSVDDLFVLVQETQPAMRENYQKHARKNHSYLIVGRFQR